MSLVNRLLVIDLPNSGQASVSYTKELNKGRSICFVMKDDSVKCENREEYYPSLVLNSVLGGGYSSRLNQEIRIKRGLSYGAGSSFSFRNSSSNFGTRTQTKNESAAEVAELVLTEINKLNDGKVSKDELDPRKLVLTGGFGRSLETTGGLAGAIADLYSYDLPTTILNSYMTSVNDVSDKQIQDFASANLKGGDLIIVGDYAKFKDDLAKRFPKMNIQVISADKLDITRPNLINPRVR
jgi:zinc protease